MKIETITIYEVGCELKQPFAYSRSWMTRRGAALVEITTDTGLTGWGEAFGPPHMSVGALKLIRPMLLGTDPLATETMWNEVYGRLREHGQKGPLVDALSAIDIALWDIKGKFWKLPVHRLMGGPIRTSVPCYATGLYRRQDGDPEQYLAEEAREYIKRGFGAV